MKIIILTLILILTLPIPSFAASWPNTEFECLAANIYHEARGEPILGQFMVAHVTLNRVSSGKFPSSICKVVKQPDQFSWYNPRQVKKPTDKKSWNQAKAIARKFLIRRPKDITKGSLFYHASYATPAWAEEFKMVAKVGEHIFYRYD